MDRGKKLGIIEKKFTRAKVAQVKKSNTRALEFLVVGNISPCYGRYG